MTRVIEPFPKLPLTTNLPLSQELLAVLGKMVGDKLGPGQLVSLVNRVFKEEDFDEVCQQNVFAWKLKHVSGWRHHI